MKSCKGLPLIPIILYTCLTVKEILDIEDRKLQSGF